MILEEKIIPIDSINTDNYYGFVYITQNLIDGKMYIGKRKFSEKWKIYLGSGKYLKRAVKKYGKENFIKQIIFLGKTKEDVTEKEIEIIKKYNAVNNENFYNISKGGDGGWQMDGFTEEQLLSYKKNMSHIIKERYKDEEYKEFIRQKTIEAVSTKEHRENKSKSIRRAYENNPDYKIKVSLGGKKSYEKNPNRRETQRKNMKKRMSNPDEKAKLSKKWSGENNPNYNAKLMTEEHKQKLIESRESMKVIILMYDLEWNLIREISGLRETLRYLNVKSNYHLDKAIKNQTEYKGHYWKKISTKKRLETIETVT